MTPNQTSGIIGVGGRGAPARLPAGKLATTNQVNRLIESIDGLQPVLQTGVPPVQPMGDVRVTVKAGAPVEGRAGWYEGSLAVETFGEVEDQAELVEENVGTFPEDDEGDPVADCLLWNLSEINGGGGLTEGDVLRGEIVAWAAKEAGGDLYPVVVVGTASGIVVCKISSNIAANDYNAKSIRGEAVLEATYSANDFGTAADEDDVICRDRAQVGGAAARPLTGLIVAGRVIGRDDKGTPIVEFASSVQKIRLNTTSGQLQVSYLPNPAGDTDWVDMVETDEACEE